MTDLLATKPVPWVHVFFVLVCAVVVFGNSFGESTCRTRAVFSIMMNRVILSLTLVAVECLFCVRAAVATTTTTTSQVDAAVALIARLVGDDRAQAFSLSLEPRVGSTDAFSLPAGLTDDGKIAITGTSGVALASGFNWCVRVRAHSDFCDKL